MAEGYVPKPIVNREEGHFEYNSQVKSGSWGVKFMFGNVVAISGYVIISDDFPIQSARTVVSTDVPVTNDHQYCGIVRFENTSIPPALVIASPDGLGITSRNTDIRGQGGYLFATYISKD